MMRVPAGPSHRDSASMGTPAPLVLSMDEGFRDSQEAKSMSEEHGQDDDELFDAPERGSADELLDAGAHSDLDAMRHSTAHVMAEAVLELYPGTKLGIGPATADGFYYAFELRRPR